MFMKSRLKGTCIRPPAAVLGKTLLESLHDMYTLELGQYTNISIYRNTDNCNIISIHPITVSIY